MLDANPNALIIIEGIQIYPKDIDANNFVSTDNDKDYYNTWWGANLMAVRKYPIDFGSPERNAQIVYSPHDYGPIVYEQPWFQGGFTYDSLMKDVWYDYWLYIQEENIAPIFVGEWGGFMEGDNLKWMEYIRQLIAEKHLHHTFWCFNANSGDTGGLVKDDFKTWDEEKYNFVKEVLWQTEEGKFIGLDHAVQLGANGIALSDYTGVTITPAPVKISVETTEATESNPAGNNTVSEETTDIANEKDDGSGITRDSMKKAAVELLLVVIFAAVFIIIILIVILLAKRRHDKKRSAEEEIILADPCELNKIDKNNSNTENTAGDVGAIRKLSDDPQEVD